MTWPFENDTSAVIHKIASAKLKYGKLQKRISIFAIALAAMLMSAVLLLISGIAAVNRSGGNSVTGSYHALISGVSQEEFERLQAEQESVLTGLTVSLGGIKAGILVLFGLECLLSAWTVSRQRKQSLVDQMRAVE